MKKPDAIPINDLTEIRGITENSSRRWSKTMILTVTVGQNLDFNCDSRSKSTCRRNHQFIPNKPPAVIGSEGGGASLSRARNRLPDLFCGTADP